MQVVALGDEGMTKKPIFGGGQLTPEREAQRAARAAASKARDIANRQAREAARAALEAATGMSIEEIREALKARD